MRLHNKRVIGSLLILISVLSAPLSASGRVASLAARQPVRAKHGIVASTNQLASQVGVDVLKRGGNAIDAAVAVALALAVTYPAAGNLGGGGFMMIRLRNGKTTAIDYREMAPAAAHRNVYLDKDGNLLKGEGSSTVGYRASGVPGTVAGLELALKKYGSGKLTWAQLVEPARRLASEGFAMGYRSGAIARWQRVPANVSGNAANLFTQWKLLQGGRDLSAARACRNTRAPATIGTERVLPGSDCATNRRRHEAEQRPDHHGRHARLCCQGTATAARQLSRLSGYLHAAAIVGRRSLVGDAQYSRRL